MLKLYNTIIGTHVDSQQKEFDYLNPDSEKSFIENQQKFTNWEYSTKPVRYKVNSFGHRNDYELKDIDTPYGLAIGCSYTFGVGLNVHDMYSNQLSQRLHIPIYNAGLNGSSNAISCFNTIEISRIKPPRFIIFQVTDRHRFPSMKMRHQTIIDQIRHIGPWCIQSESHLQTLFTKYSQEGITEFNHIFMFISLIQYFRLLNIPIIFVEAIDVLPKFFINTQMRSLLAESRIQYLPWTFVKDDYARDRNHPGSRSHTNMAQQLFSLLQSYE